MLNYPFKWLTFLIPQISHSTWFSTTQLGSICASPSGSKTTVWYSLKSVRVTSAFSGQTSMVSMIVSLSKSVSQTLPTPLPGRIDRWTDQWMNGSEYKRTSTLVNLDLYPPSESSCRGLGISRQLSGPGGSRSGMPSLSSSSSHSSPLPSLSVSSWELLMTAGQLSRESWWPSPSLGRRDFDLRLLTHILWDVTWLMRSPNTCLCWCHKGPRSGRCPHPSEKNDSYGRL